MAFCAPSSLLFLTTMSHSLVSSCPYHHRELPKISRSANFCSKGLGFLRSQILIRSNSCRLRANSTIVVCEKMDDGFYMRRCVELARKAIGHTSPNPMVGCVIVDDAGEIVGEGFHPKAGQPHAEVSVAVIYWELWCSAIKKVPFLSFCLPFIFFFPCRLFEVKKLQ